LTNQFCKICARKAGKSAFKSKQKTGGYILGKTELSGHLFVIWTCKGCKQPNRVFVSKTKKLMNKNKNPFKMKK
jgi:hypothetical protein